MTEVDLKKYARIGAEVQLEKIFTVFPDLRERLVLRAAPLRKKARRAKMPAGASVPARDLWAARARLGLVAVKRRPLSADARKRISRATRRRWKAAKALGKSRLS